MVTDSVLGFWDNVAGIFSAMFGWVSFSMLENFFTGVAILIIPLIFIAGKVSLTRPFFRKVYGEIEDPALNKFILLAFCFLLLIGSYWVTRVLKDALLAELVGYKKWAPVAKMVSAVTTMLALFIFNKFVYRFKKHRLFLAVGGVYATIFVVLAVLYYLKLPELSFFPFSLIPGRAVGWAYYLVAESLGSVMIPAVFWAFAVSTTTTRLAKVGFPIIYIAGQCGLFLGPTAALWLMHNLGYFHVMLIGVLPLAIIPMIIEYLVLTTPSQYMVTDQGSDEKAAKPKTGMLEGIRLIVTKPYLMGVLAMATLYEIVATILEWMYKSKGEAMTVGTHGTAFGVFVAQYAQVIAMFSLTFAIIGTSFLIRRLGVRACMMLYPLIMAGLVAGLLLNNSSLALLMIASVASKGLAYVLNAPLKELIYLPTSKDVKFKAKGFIDGLGGRSSKSVASVITGTIGRVGDASGAGFVLANLGPIVALSIIGVWAVAAFLLGATYNQLIENNKIIE